MMGAIKWIGVTVLCLAVAAFIAFLYFIPPFSLMKPEQFSGPAGREGADLSGMSDPGERMIAERGRYLVTIGACAGCHSTPGPQGPRADMHLAGGFKMMRAGQGTYVSMNLTPDKATGIGSWSDDDIKRVLRNGVAPDGRQVPGHLMPWPVFSNWSDEDMHAVVVYLRHTAPIVHRIPKPAAPSLSHPSAFEEDYGGVDYATPAGPSEP